MKRAYSIIDIKSIDEENGKRIFRGIATTPTPDRIGDIVEPKGAEFKLPIPLCWMHDSSDPVGWVTAAKITDKGIEIEGEVANLPEPQALKERLDTAWAMMKSKLVRGLSIGFKPLEEARIGDTYSYRYLKWLWLELSPVTIPANGDCSITSIKSIDQQQRRAASGTKGDIAVVHLKSIPGASGKTQTIPKGNESMKPIAEQIASFEAKRAAAVARMTEIMSKAGDEGRTLEAAETEEYDTLKTEMKTVDEHLVRLKEHEQQLVQKAAPVTKAAGTDPDAASGTRGGSPIISVRSNLEKGIAFTRFVKSLIAGQGNIQLALMHAQNQKGWKDSTPQVVEVLKTAVAGGLTTAAGWASELVYNQNLVGEFVELLRPQTILGKMPGLTRVPFNVRMAGQDSGSTGYWVGQGKPIPVSKLNTLEVTLGIAKAAGLVVLSEELVRSSEPSAELLVRNDLIKTIATFTDVQFVDPNVAAVANVSPASITNGVTAVVPTGTTLAALRTDVQTLFRTFITANDDPSSCVWIMDPTMALTFSLMQNALGQAEHPDITMNGGTFFGLPVVVSNSANIPGSPDSGHMVILAKASDILFADEGAVEIDASREASVQMLDNPTNASSDGTPTTMVSMFQTNSVAIRAVRFINWKKRRSTAVAYIKEAQYVA
jgi:HK97 family phage major capsid protein/HK97 family phage prohead protease